jgi:alkylation response protein AidB-like acyl-CoA dehydrogenase
VVGVAPHLGLVEVTGSDLPFTARRDLDAGDWTEAVALCRLAVGHELVGASRRMLDEARVHALLRIQFDRPISSFQAVRHRLADTLVAIEAGDAALESAWDERSPASAAMAKALAGRAARTTARHGQQVLAGIGFTTEHGFHRSVRRVLVLDELFGSAASLTRELGRRLLATGELPPLPPL